MTTPTPSSLWQEAVASISRTSFQYTVLTTAPDGSEMIAITDLSEPATAAYLAERFQDHYQPSHRHKAGSLAFQRAAHRLIGISVGCWLLDGKFLHYCPDHTHVIVANGAVTAIHVDVDNPPALVQADAVEVIERTQKMVIPIMSAFSQATGVGWANLTGNCAATISAAARNIVRHELHRDPEVMKHHAEELIRLWPGMSRLGWFETIGGKLFYYRNSCCHWHSTGADNCDWCTKRPVPQRRLLFTHSVSQTS